MKAVQGSAPNSKAQRSLDEILMPHRLERLAFEAPGHEESPTALEGDLLQRQKVNLPRMICNICARRDISRPWS